MPYLTPDSIAADLVCRPLRIPNTDRLLWAVSGALYELTRPENWELFGDVTPSEAAAAMSAMLDEYFTGTCASGGSTMALGAIVRRSDDLSWPFATVTTWQAVDFDGGAFSYDDSDRLTAPEDGVYQIGASLAINMTSSGEVFADLQIDGSTLLARAMHYQSGSTGIAYLHLETVAALDEGQYVRLVHPTLGSGATYTLKALANYSPRFWMIKLSDLE